MERARVPFTDNVTLAVIGTEGSKVLQADPQGPTIKAFQLKSKSSDPLKYAYSPGGPYITIPPDQTKWEEGLFAYNLTLYLVGTVVNQVAEIEWWV